MERALANSIKHGSAFFDGVNKGIEIASTAIIADYSNGFTVEGWFYCTVNEIKEFIIKTNSFELYHRQQKFGFRLNGNAFDGIGTTVFPLNTWVHGAMTYDGTTVRLYVNGNLDTSGAYATAVGSNANPVNIGSYADGRYPHNGNIDEVRIWNYARTAKQIAANYKSVVKPQAGLVGYWKLDGNALDSSGNGNDGVVNGGVTWSETVAPDLEKVRLTTSGNKLLTSRSKQPYALKFDGSGIVDNIPLLDLFGTPTVTDVTIGMWIYYENTSNANDTLFVAVADDTTNRFLVHFNYSNTIYFDLGHISTGGRIHTTAPTDRLNKWEYWAFTVEAGVGMKIWRNGEILKSTTTTSTLTLDANRVLRIGNLLCKTVKPYIFNRALTQAELKHHMIHDEFSDYTGFLDQWDVNPSNPTLIRGVNGNDGTLAAEVVHSTAPVGQRSSLYFGGNGQVVNFGNPASFTDLTTFTVEGWLHWGTSSGGSVFLSKYNGTNAGFYIIKNGNTNIGFGLYDSSGAYSLSAPIVYKKWTHYAFTHDYDTGVFKIFINGVESISGVNPRHQYGGRYNPDNTSDILMGGVGSLASARASHGFLRVHQGVLTPEQMKANMHRYLPASTPNLIEQWKLDEGIGATVFGTKGNNGTITGAIWKEPTLANWRAGHLKVVGAGDYVQVKNSPSLIVKKGVTVEGWVNPSDVTTAEWRYLANKLSHYFVRFWGNDVQFAVHIGGSWKILGFNDNINAGVWVHVVGVYDGVELKLYLNGQLKATLAETGILSNSVDDLHIAANAGTQDFIGGIDEVRIWNTARSQAEIQENMNRVLDRHPNLVGYWRFDHDNYWDASGNGNHGTPVNGPVIEDNDNDKLNYIAPIN